MMRRARVAHEARRRLVQHHVAALEVVVAEAQPVRVPRRERRLQRIHLAQSETVTCECQCDSSMQCLELIDLP